MPSSRTESTGASSVASSSSTAATASTSIPIALPTEEALQILLSPDGYYNYLGISKPEPDAMGLKYQEAMTAGGGGGDGGGGRVDLERVKKNYRRLSLKHHPDRPTGDAETFRMLNRAKIVLSNAKLRREYDLVGLDLDDDAEDEGGHHEEESKGTAAENAEGPQTSEAHEEDKGDRNERGGGSKTETVMGHLASTTLAAILQVVVRTVMMGLVSVLISKYTLLTYPAMGLLALLTTKMYSAIKKSLGPKDTMTLSTMKDAFSPLVIALGIFFMYRGRRYVIPSVSAATGVVGESMEGDNSTASIPSDIEYHQWSWTFLVGEALVMTSFIANSVDNQLLSRVLVLAFSGLSLLLSLWLRGRFWRYMTLLGFEGLIGALVVLAFPIMEMILESLVEEKMRKVGEKIRAHDVRMKEMLNRKKGSPSSG